jgi:maltose O-acetyltransferase
VELTEKEKMIAGKLYFAGDPELVADRRDARLRLRAINQESDREKREEFVKQAFWRDKEPCLCRNQRFLLIMATIFL